MHHLPWSWIGCALLALTFALPPATAQSPALTAHADGNGVSIRDATDKLLGISLQAWGPGWAHTSVPKGVQAEGTTSQGTFSGKLSKTNAPYTVQARFSRPDAKSLELEYSLAFAEATDLTLFIIDVAVSPRYEQTKLRFTDGGTEKEEQLPLERRGLGQAVSEIRFTDATGAPTILTLDPPAEVASDGNLRVVLAKEKAAANTPKTQRLRIQLPAESAWYADVAQIPDPPDWDQWFPWQGTGAVPEDSVLHTGAWLDGPAGKYGRITRKGDQLLRNGKALAFWGINVCYAATAPDKALAERRAAFYASHGINAVRLHKYADGHGWAGILSRDSFTQFDPAALDRMDYFIAELKKRGIYTKFSPTFGTFKLGPLDKEKVPYMGEFGSGSSVTTPHAAAYLGREVGDLQIEQMLNLLKHKNPHTGLTYAEDPAIMVVELLNEQSILFFGTMEAMKRSPTLRQRAGERFTAWLLQRYGSKEAVLQRWGKGGLNTFAGEGFKDESFEQKAVYPVGNPWFYDPTQLDGSQKARKPRLLDTMAFLYELQNEFYTRYTQALRQAGYTGEIVASNWQAGRAFSHYYNLHSDAQAGIVDRHNYFKGATPMLHRPGSGMLSAGMQQVAGIPFMLSEWIHEFPTRFPSEGPAILAAYGMGLQGWDVSYIFHNKDNGTYEPRLGGELWIVAQPEIFGLFPALSRQVLRGDVRPSDAVAVRSVHIPSLHEGRLGFDDQVRQGYDDKSFDSTTVPAAALAAVRSVVSFDAEFKETPAFDMTPYLKDGAIVSSTGQLRWQPGANRDDGHFTIDSPGTAAVVGFASGRTHDLAAAAITPRTAYAAIYLTASEPDRTLADSSRVLITTIGHTMNTDMKRVDSQLLAPGQAPIRMQPITADIRLKRPGTPTLHILDHNGARTGKTIPVQNGAFTLDGAASGSCYYELAY
jgi:hypothetical protein